MLGVGGWGYEVCDSNLFYFYFILFFGYYEKKIKIGWVGGLDWGNKKLLLVFFFF